MGTVRRGGSTAAGAAFADNSNEPKLLPTQEAKPLKVLRLAFRTAETGFDPAKINDIYSLAVNSHIFEALYAYDHLARPAKIKPRLAAGMPEFMREVLVGLPSQDL